jgi:hypothetical protein
MSWTLTEAASLEFLLNPIYTQTGKKGKAKGINSSVPSSELKFYRKRIEAVTKTLLKGGAEDMPFQDAYLAYVTSVIRYFKAIDRHELVQEQLLHSKDDTKAAEEAEEDKNAEFNLQKANEVMQLKKIHYANLDNYIQVHETTENADARIIPVQLELNLQTPALKRKGVRPKKHMKKSSAISADENALLLP